jgi:hypothetical protein
MAIGVVALGWTDRTSPMPPLRLAAWTSLSPLMAVFDVVRVGLLVAVAYWVLLLTCVGLARLFRRRRWLTAISRAPGGRRAIKFLLGSAMAGSSIATLAVPAGAAPTPGPAPVLYWVPSPAGHPDLVTRPSASSSAHRRGPVTRPRVSSPARTGRTWTVRSGDDLWSIAEATLRSAPGRDPDEREIGRYWLALIDINRARLPDPSDPSLLYPGDTVVLPPPGTLLP